MKNKIVQGLGGGTINYYLLVGIPCHFVRGHGANRRLEIPSSKSEIPNRFCCQHVVTVFEGELTEAELKRLKTEALEIMDEEQDSLLIYQSRTDKYFTRETLGVDMGGLIDDNQGELFV